MASYDWNEPAPDQPQKHRAPFCAFFLAQGGKAQPSISPFIGSERSGSKDLLLSFLKRPETVLGPIHRGCFAMNGIAASLNTGGGGGGAKNTGCGMRTSHQCHGQQQSSRNMLPRGNKQPRPGV